MAESTVMQALRHATEKVNRENKHPDEPPLVMPEPNQQPPPKK